MKKLVTMALVCALTLSLAGCGSKPQEPASTPAESGSIQTTSYFGKVTAVVGNEIEIDLAKEPEAPEPPASQPELEGDEMAAITLTPSMEAGTSTEGGGAATRTEVEYTGEVKSFVIPSGLAIKDAMGNEKQLSEIKKGSIMNVFADENGNVVEVYLYE